ncbi:MAG: DUF4440 domain-containing protein [Sphingopyxis sp.]
MKRMILALLFALIAIPAVAQETSLEPEAQAVLATERAFDAAAARDGQWTAFRAFAASDATMFTPQPVNVQEWLSGRADPAQSVRWQPHAVYIACDATLAVTTGAWQRANGTVGYFTTVWRKQADGTWKWLLDHGDTLTVARVAPVEPIVHVPDCAPLRSRLGLLFDPLVGGVFNSDDHRLRVTWEMDSSGTREVRVAQLTGQRMSTVLNNVVAAQTP